jgi:hypothetical protein
MENNLFALLLGVPEEQKKHIESLKGIRRQKKAVKLLKAIDAGGLLDNPWITRNLRRIITLTGSRPPFDLPSFVEDLKDIKKAGVLDDPQIQAQIQKVYCGDFGTDPLNVLLVLIALQKGGYLNNDLIQKNLSKIVENHEPTKLVEVFTALYKKKLLDNTCIQENLLEIISHVRPVELVESLIDLQESGLLDNALIKKNFAKIIHPSNSCNLIFVLIYIHRESLLNSTLAQEDLADIIEQKKFWNEQSVLIAIQKASFPDNALIRRILAKIIEAGGEGQECRLPDLRDEHILESSLIKEYFIKISEHRKLCNLVWALAVMKHEELLDNELIKENFKEIIEHETPGILAEALVDLKTQGLLNNALIKENFKGIIKRTDFRNFEFALGGLKKQGLLDYQLIQKKFTEIIKYSDLYILTMVLCKLKKAGLLDDPLIQKNFTEIIKYSDPGKLNQSLKSLIDPQVDLRVDPKKLFAFLFENIYLPKLLLQESLLPDEERFCIENKKVIGDMLLSDGYKDQSDLLKDAVTTGTRLNKILTTGEKSGRFFKRGKVCKIIEKIKDQIEKLEANCDNEGGRPLSPQP